MFSLKSIVLIAAVFVGAECSGVVPAVPAAPLIAAPAHVGYAHAVPQNIPPYASQINVVNRAVSPIVATPLARFAPTAAVAAPLAAGPYLAASSPAYPSAYAAAPYGYPTAFAGPAAYAAPAAYAGPAAYATPAAYAGPAAYAAPYPYGAAPAPLLRSPYGYAPAFVR